MCCFHFKYPCFFAKPLLSQKRCIHFHLLLLFSCIPVLVVHSPLDDPPDQFLRGQSVTGFDRPNLKLSVAAKRDWRKQMMEFLEEKKGMLSFSKAKLLVRIACKPMSVLEDCWQANNLQLQERLKVIAAVARFLEHVSWGKEHRDAFIMVLTANLVQR